MLTVILLIRWSMPDGRLTMKLRVLENSVRLRLSVPEVGLLGSGSAVSATLNVPSAQAFRYELSAAEGDSASASFDGQTLRIAAPAKDLERWSCTDIVTLAYRIGAPPDTMTVKIEKDFQCLAPRAGEDERMLFPNPSNDAHGDQDG